MGVIFDIIGMLIIRASIIAIILNLMVNLHEALYKYTERNYLNTTLSAAVQTISADVTLAGYNSSNKRFPIARNNDMSFRSDIDNNGTVDIVRYYVNPTTGVNKVLYRTVNSGTALEVARDVDTFLVRYYRPTGSTVTGTDVNNIKSLQITLEIISKQKESSAQDAFESDTRVALWQQHFFPENL